MLKKIVGCQVKLLVGPVRCDVASKYYYSTLPHLSDSKSQAGAHSTLSFVWQTSMAAEYQLWRWMKHHLGSTGHVLFQTPRIVHNDIQGTVDTGRNYCTRDATSQ